MSVLAFWNTADLIPPPENAARVQISLNDVTKLRKVFHNAFNALKVLDTLDMEAALLSRVISKSKSRFRADKMLHKLEAVNRGLLKYLALNITNVYKSFNTKLHNIQERKINSETVVPSRQMLEWVLVRTQGFARLLCYLAHNCQEAVKGWLDPVKRGHIWNLTPIVIGILSRIWAIAKYLIVHTCSWYTELLPFRLVLKSVGLRWLPSDYVVPENIVLWLNMPHITDTADKKGANNLELSLKQFLEMSDDEDSKEDEKNSSKQKGLTDFLDANDEDKRKAGNQSNNPHNNPIGLSDNEGSVRSSSIVSTNTQISNTPFINAPSVSGVNASVDIGEYVPREIQTKSTKKKLKKRKIHEKQNTMPGSQSQRNVLLTKETERKRKRKDVLKTDASASGAGAASLKKKKKTKNKRFKQTISN